MDRPINCQVCLDPSSFRLFLSYMFLMIINYINFSVGFQLRSKIRGICFTTVTSVIAVFLFVLMVVSHPFVLLRDRYQRNFHHFIAKIWASMSIAPFFRLKIQGSENLPPKDSPAIYVSNHQSFLDIYTLLTLGRNFKFVSKTAIFLYPIVGWAMFLMGTIPLKRMDRKSQLVSRLPYFAFYFGNC